MKIVVLEHFTSTHRAGAPPDLEIAGRAMRDAIMEDLLALPGFETHAIERCADREKVFQEEVKLADAALVIAPEEDGVLERMTRLVEQEDRLLLGPGSAAVRLAGDKLAMMQRLAAARIPTPATQAISFASAVRRLRGRERPFIVKPRDGCGCQGVCLIRRRDRLAAAIDSVRKATRRDDFLVQEYLPGEHASVSLIVRARNRHAGSSPPWVRRIMPLALNRQWIDRSPHLAYRGGEVPWGHPMARAACALAVDAVRTLEDTAGGARGFLGVDLVLTSRGPFVIEINPRLTTAYLGLRRALSCNPAAWIMDASRGQMPLDRVVWRGCCSYHPDGRIETRALARGREGWRSTTAGTSAASI